MCTWYEYELPEYTACTIKTKAVGKDECTRIPARILGLEKPKSALKQKYFIESYIQSIIESAPMKKTSIAIGGNGDQISQFIGEKAVQVCAANEISNIYIGTNNLFILPAISRFIRENKLEGGIYVYVARNYTNRKKVNVGIRFLGTNGGVPSEKIMKKTLDTFKTLTSHKKINVNFPLSEVENYSFRVIQSVDRARPPSTVTVHIIDGKKDYIRFLKESFDFPRIKSLITGGRIEKRFDLVVDCKEGGAGPYLEEILVNELGAKKSCIKNGVPSSCFHKKYFGPEVEYNLQMINELVLREQDMGVIIDGNGARSAFFAKGGHFVSHGDTFALLVDHYHCIPLFQKKIVKGIARTVYASKSVDPVILKLGLSLYETADGWRYFNSLLEHQLISLCADDDFGIGAYHIGERDGILPILAWLSIIAHLRKPVRQILQQHWDEYGKLFRTTLIYEDLCPKLTNDTISNVEKLMKDGCFVGKAFQVGHMRVEVKKAGGFDYKHPLTKASTKEQAIVINTKLGRVILRVFTYIGGVSDLQVIIESFSNGVAYCVDKISMAVPLTKFIMLATKYPAMINRSDPDRIF
ncbi:phosphoglucomutase-like [Cimex lectularius]|uniref:Phosphoglucomutase n=1 Tax=Cimex lectularius TaxID=79782 RepID=A0A8I6TEN5_CIMLE|nr:phosphoglucomutase-like [Cimex lectularius]